MWRLIYAIPSWILFSALRLVLMVVGVVMVPLALLFRAYKVAPSEYTWGNNGQDIHRFTWKIMLPWQNPEDGFYNTTYFDNGFILTTLKWTLLRNVVNGLRRVPYLSLMIDMKKVKYIGSHKGIDSRFYSRDEQTFWYLCWQGFYTQFRIQFNYKKTIKSFRIGWKIYPQDADHVVTGHRINGAGFGSRMDTVWPK